MSRVALAPGHAREYETVYVLRPNVDREIADDVAGRIADAIRGTEGKLTSAELWGRRRLAYPIQRHHRGIYIYVKYLGGGGTVSELERQLRLADSVIRYQSILVRDNVPVASADTDDAALKLDFDLPSEPDEPELTRERELGLDQPMGERRRRDDRRDDVDDDMGDDDEGMGGGRDNEESE
jgi:small subunit ribosomal protein S6